MKNKIIKILNDLVQIKSFTNSSSEEYVSRYVFQHLNKLKYFRQNPQHIGQFHIAGDIHGRSVFYALVLGASSKTFVSMGHFDVVGIEEYGSLMESAFNSDALAEGLKGLPIDAESRADLESGDWIFGRGTADMKGGLAIHIALLEEYAENNERNGSMLLIGVPDEESYSAGMRAAGRLLKDLKLKYNLDYRLLVDPEPNTKIDKKQIISTGSVGKCLPVVMVQGVKAHLGRCFEGISPLRILTDIFQATDMSLEFSDKYRHEATLPPVWTFLRDRKNEYDVSIPYRACGYFSVLSLNATPDETMNKLKNISIRAFKKSVAQLDEVYQEFKKTSRFALTEAIDYEPLVLEYGELLAMLKHTHGAAFDGFYEKAYGDIAEKLIAGELNYPEATVELMEKTLTFAELQKPLVLLAFTPPFYPAINSDNIKGRENMADTAYQFLVKAGEKHGLDMEREYYFTGISDLSYCGMDRAFNYQAFSINTPLWGSLYEIDFQSIEEIAIPSIIFGPWGKDLHKMTERVNKTSLTETIPKITKELIEFLWEQ